MKRMTRRWIARILAIVMIITCIPMGVQKEAKANDYTSRGCVDWVKDRAREKGFGELPKTGLNKYGLFGASAYWTNLPKQYIRSNDPIANSLAIWEFSKVQADKYYGHVAYVESVNGNNVMLSEGGVYGYSHAGHTGVRAHTVTKSSIASSNNGFLGYIYLPGAASNPDPVPQPAPQASVQAVSCDKYDTNLVPRARVYNPAGKHITTVGIILKDHETVIATKEEMMTRAGQYATNPNIWFDCNKELGITLRPGHVYNWQIYATVDGKKVYTDRIYDKTTGTEKPNAPSFSTAKTNYAVGDAVTVSWGADINAISGYSLTLTQTKGGNYTKTLTTNTANATSLAFSLPSAGEYKITGFARGSVNSDTATLNKTIVAHNPCKVSFVEYDKDGKENLLCEQEVRYGYSATAPLGISRKGHTFIGWKGEYSNVTSDRTIEAQFKRNTYKITFCDKDGNTIKTESVLYEGNATVPSPPKADTGYVFAGWDSEDYLNVQDNATIKATYVWANDDLPVVISLNKCEFKEDGYIINYDIKNNPNSRTKGRALVSLKTSKGKLMDSTESKAFSLGKAEEKKGIEIYVPYEGTATKAELYIINGFSKGIPISEVASIDVSRDWSEWSAEKPGANNEIESRTEYRYKNKETTVTRTSSNSGWTLYDTILDSNWSYGAWSGWSRNSYSAYTNTTNKREVETRSVQDSAGKTLYNWYYYRYWNTSAGKYYYTYSSSMGGTRYDWQTDYVLPQIGTYSGHAGYKPPGGKNFASEIWFLASTQNVPASYHTEWRYRDATKGYNYYWYRWPSEWTQWSPTAITANDNRKVEIRTAYRYRAKMEDIEDNSGKSYTISGKVDAKLAGKQATLLVYKNEEPSDYNNEYVGQIAIKNDGSYSYTFIPRETISAKTGDYTVALALEGAENPVFLDKIFAPKPQYTVTFKDNEGKIIKTQTVSEGQSATAPKAPAKEHYTFIGWDFGVTNIKDDIEITAQYTKNKYSVAYVNWETKEAETRVFSYGDAIEYPDETKIEGYDFVGWTTLDGKKVTEITDNIVVQANYKIQTYTINFYDKDEKLINTQRVDYGQDAVEPEHEEIDKMIFKGWNTYGFIQAKSDLDVYPVYEWQETTENPSCDTESGVFTESKTVHLEAEDGADIYYTTDGTTPGIFSEKYDGEIIISTNTYLQFVAVAPEKNMSETKAVSFLVASGEDDEGALVVKREKYPLDRGTQGQITYFLSHDNPEIGVNFYSLNDDIATVDEDGKVYANNVGKTQIFVSTKDNRYADYCEIEVTTDDIEVESIELDKYSVAGVKNETIQINATVYPANATYQEVDWYTADNSIATVSENGEIVIHKEGKTTLYAYSKTGSCIAECSVKGVNEFNSEKLNISIPYLFLYENEKANLQAYIDDAEVTCSWESSNPDVATVDEGLITAHKAGYAVVVATTEDGATVTSMVVVEKENADEQQPSPTPTQNPQPTLIPNAEPTQNQQPALKPSVDNKVTYSFDTTLQGGTEVNNNIKKIKVSAVKIKKNTTKITGMLSVKKATVKIKVGNKAWKKATVKGKKFTLKVAKLKKKTKITVKVTKKGYKMFKKTYKVK